jgi:endonuclease III-like uncharacterized protein
LSINKTYEEIKNTLRGNIKEMFDVLVDTHGSITMFISNYYSGDINRIFVDLLKFREFKINNGVGQNITSEQFYKANDMMLKSLLQSLFQMNITVGDVKTFKRDVEDVDLFIELHKQNKYYMFERIMNLYRTKINNNNLY